MVWFSVLLWCITLSWFEGAWPRIQNDWATRLRIGGAGEQKIAHSNNLPGLEAKGYQVVLPELPSCSHVESPDFPTKTLLDDALAVRTELGRLIEQEGKVVLMVQHSYGGLVGSEAVTEGLSYEKRQALGLSGGVFYLFLYAAFLLEEGQSFIGEYGESPNTDVRVSPHETFFFFPFKPANLEWKQDGFQQSDLINMIPLQSLTVAFIFGTGHQNYTTTYHPLKRRNGLLVSFLNPMRSRKPSLRRNHGDIYLPHTSYVKMIRSCLQGFRRFLPQRQNRPWRNVAQATLHT